MMKITAFNGSPWGQEGHTHLMTRGFLAGAAHAGAGTQTLQLAQKKIEPCHRCGVCFYKTPGKCALKDDMAGLIREFRASDVVVFATPVYIDNVTALMKAFIDRLNPLLEPHYDKDSSGEYRRRSRFENYPRFVIISSCALPEQTNFQVLRIFFRRMARTFHAEVAGEIYRAAAGLLLLSKQDVRFQPVVKEYITLLHAAGEEFVKTGRISEQTSGKLETPIVDPDEYAEDANKIWDHLLPKTGLTLLAGVLD
ncbi:MAG TPA: flavodoxin family protein [Sedimentisphaerales bacterium]|nr:flavodoxin family protein [Sedimentisphaerales bacterium]